MANNGIYNYIVPPYAYVPAAAQPQLVQYADMGDGTYMRVATGTQATCNRTELDRAHRDMLAAEASLESERKGAEAKRKAEEEALRASLVNAQIWRVAEEARSKAEEEARKKAKEEADAAAARHTGQFFWYTPPAPAPAPAPSPPPYTYARMRYHRLNDQVWTRRG